MCEKTVLLDSNAGVGADAVGAATAQDVLLAASVQPYTRLTVETASFAQARGVPVVAITDSVLSPLAKVAASTIVVPTESPSFLHSKIGSAAWRERVCQYVEISVVAVSLKKN